MSQGKRLVCPYCGSTLEAILEYSPYAYSEHRDLTGFECDDFACAASWDKYGRVVNLPLDKRTEAS